MRPAARLIIAIAVNSACATATQLPVKIYTTADGLADNRVNKIVRDSRGYLWFCTQEGLSRFDGYSFTNYGPQQGLPPRAINDLLETRTGEYWLATSGGLVRFDPTSTDHKFRVFLPDGGEAPQRIVTIFEDHAGGLWCGTHRGLFRFERTRDGDSRIPAEWRFRRVEIGTPEGGINPARINALVEDRRGALWIGTESGLYRLLPNGASERFATGSLLPSGLAEPFATAGGLPSMGIKTLLEDHLGRLWVGTTGGLCRITSNPTVGRSIVERIYTASDGLATDYVAALFETSAGKLWAGASGASLSEVLPEPLEKSRALKTYTMSNGLSSVDIYSIAEDRDHNLWIGSADGAMKITRSSFTTFTAADWLTSVTYAPSSIRVTSIFQDRSGGLYVTTSASPRKPFLSRLQGEKFRSILPNLPDLVADIGWGTHQTVLQDHAGDWWIATTKGLARFGPPARFEQLAHARVKALYTTLDGLPTDEVFRIFEDSRGDIWVATSPYGLERWDRRTASFQRYAKDTLPGELISAFREDRAGNIWIGLYSEGVVRFRNGKFVQFNETDGLGVGGVSDIHCDRAGRLWIGHHRGGVTRIDSPESDHPRLTNIGISQGLASAQAECITEDRWGRIYVCGGRGIDRLDPEAPNGVGRTSISLQPTGLLAATWSSRSRIGRVISGSAPPWASRVWSPNRTRRNRLPPFSSGDCVSVAFPTRSQIWELTICPASN